MTQAVLEQSPPQIDANGIPILPGYRKPFAKGFDPRRNYTKGSTTSATKRQANARAAETASSPLEVAAKLSSLKRAHSRCLAAAVASTKGSEAAAWMRAAKDALEQLQSLLGHNPKSHKSTKKPHLAGLAPSAKIEPLPSGNCEPIPTSACPTLETDATPKVEPIPPKSPEIDDCPF